MSISILIFISILSKKVNTCFSKVQFPSVQVPTLLQTADSHQQIPSHEQAYSRTFFIRLLCFTVIIFQFCCYSLCFLCHCGLLSAIIHIRCLVSRSTWQSFLETYWLKPLLLRTLSRYIVLLNTEQLHSSSEGFPSDLFVPILFDADIRADAPCNFIFGCTLGQWITKVASCILLSYYIESPKQIFLKPLSFQNKASNLHSSGKEGGKKGQCSLLVLSCILADSTSTHYSLSLLVVWHCEAM